jgi:hypothetical protein
MSKNSAKQRYVQLKEWLEIRKNISLIKSKRK